MQVKESSKSNLHFLYRIFSQVCSHPKQILCYLKPYKIKRLFYYFFHGGLKEVTKVLDDRVLMGTDLKLAISIEKTISKKNIYDYPPICFPDTSTPLVSIIIPVHNQFDYTYACLRSIAKNTGTISYEILIADDCSSDFTAEISKIIPNITVVKTDIQAYFLRNCNNAALKANGKYLLFLNNDTQVQQNWLTPLVELLEREPQIGLTGSCLVYPDGKLQEAGGIIWNDGSAWNYGNGKNPAMPEYRYVKEVDYISGASIMIRKSIWEQLGGFDERFAPAYCEDSDLAFSVRKLGYKVVYQPASIVVHFEGVSNGKDTSTGIKAYQLTNQTTFFNKWKPILAQEHLKNGTDSFLAGDRSQAKKRILILDHRVPCYDRDAGARTVSMYIKLFLKQGFKVVFFPDDFYPLQPYTQELEQLGVEVLYGNYYMTHWKDWLEENLKYFHYVYLNRPQVSIKYIDIIKKMFTGKVFYYGHDLHYLREKREYEVTHNPELLESSERWLKIEKKLFEQADVIYAVGDYEYSILKEKFRNKVIRNVPAYIYPQISGEIEIDLDTRKDLLFVGGFGHPPNIDAVLWFGKEIFPQILEKYPDITWRIVGANPPQEIQAMASKNIKLLGFVSDDELKNLYHTSRLVVIPLRYGAGVKGKVVESLYHCCPLITTPVGAEGIPLGDKNLWVVENDNDMACKIITLYEDKDTLTKMMKYSKEVINNAFTEEKVLEVIAQDFDMNLGELK
ncbi:MAG: glycosyltransferase [Lachnospiraceae bacterium]|nr:glycosyltransferase [Lachnospiraceae bacterium]